MRGAGPDGQVDVGLQQRGRGRANSRGDDLRHLHEVGQDVVELLPVGVTHEYSDLVSVVSTNTVSRAAGHAAFGTCSHTVHRLHGYR